ncbi:hypothetical protein MUK60_32885 [Streptomyces sp. LRE541]|uniref:hypothetical protein n=1 Tax=Streptomyces sp. LRE541 TaxID=2931983 RepID=UPI00200BB2FC|nr:hypothetical protein [Streptomyces sp. LRE541]UPZ34569.1 hypothetical protein MUK60_32885 [Streptomyces sp. LRE541]
MTDSPWPGSWSSRRARAICCSTVSPSAPTPAVVERRVDGPYDRLHHRKRLAPRPAL